MAKVDTVHMVNPQVAEAYMANVYKRGRATLCGIPISKALDWDTRPKYVTCKRCLGILKKKGR